MNPTMRSFLDEPAVADPPARVWRDWALLGTIWVGAIVEVFVRPDVPWRPTAFVVCLALSCTVLWRRTHPLAMTAIAFGGSQTLNLIVWIATGEPGGLWAMAFLLVMPYALFRWGSGRQGAIGLLILCAAWLVGITTDPGTVGDAVGGFIVLLLPIVLGEMVRYRGVARDRAIEEARLLEREQLARELHDSVAHHVSAIAIQAQAGRTLADTNPDAAVDALGTIEEAASRTLDEMRAMVSALRRDDADLAPLPGVADIERLAQTTNGGGPAVHVELAGDLDDLRPSVDTTIYRLAQESITNAVRHARNATRIDVRVAGTDRLVRLTVNDDGDTATADPSPAAGYGLLGMTERAELLGGTLHAGPRGGRGWRITAELPRHVAPA